MKVSAELDELDDNSTLVVTDALVPTPAKLVRRSVSVSRDIVEETSAPEVTRARTREDIDNIVHEIVDIMTAGKWRTGVSHAQFMARYKADEKTVQGWATQASRLIRMCLGHGEDIRARLVVMLEDIHRRAVEKQGVTKDGNFYDSPDLHAAVAAVDSQAKLLGLITQKHDVSVSMNQYESLSRVDKAAWLRERAQAMFAEAERLEAER